MTKAELTKATAKEIGTFLASASRNAKVKADKNLFSRMQYTSKAIKDGQKVLKKDLLELATDCLAVMAVAETKPEAKKPAEKKQDKPAKESSLKKKPSKKEEPKEEPKKTTKKTTKAEEPKKTATNKKQAKTEPKKEEKPKTFSFPEEFEDEDGVKYTRADDITTIEELRKAVENDEDFVVATHWTADMLKEGVYAIDQLPKKLVPKRFENDLDLASVVFVGDITDNVLTVSLYTEALYFWKGASLKPTKNGRKGKNLMYELYRVTE